jgi:hypothetical protein
VLCEDARIPVLRDRNRRSEVAIGFMGRSVALEAKTGSCHECSHVKSTFQLLLLFECKAGVSERSVRYGKW